MIISSDLAIFQESDNKNWCKISETAIFCRTYDKSCKIMHDQMQNLLWSYCLIARAGWVSQASIGFNRIPTVKSDKNSILGVRTSVCVLDSYGISSVL